VPIQTRCPSCSAAVTPSAPWCSLCHADLRVPADPAVDLTAATPPPDVEQETESEAESEAEYEPASPGRHAAGGTVTAERPRSSGGRHAASGARVLPRPTGRTPARSVAPPPVDPVLEGIDLPKPGEATPEQVEALAERMLSRLAATESRPQLIDPRDLPGGPWGFSAAVMAVIVVVLLGVATIIGVVLSR